MTERSGTGHGETGHVALLTRDARLADEVRTVAAVAGVPLTVATADGAGASLLLLGPDAVPPARGRVLFVVRLAGPETAHAEVWRLAVRAGAEDVLTLPEDRQRLVERLVEVRSGPPGRRGRLVAVTGACGGAGASTLAVAVAVAARRAGARTVLVDGDPWGGGLDVACGVEDVPGLRWPDLARSRGRLPDLTLRAALPEVAGVALLSWARDTAETPDGETVAAALEACRRSADLVVLDRPRGHSAPPGGPADAVVLAVPARVRAVAAAAGSARWLSDGAVTGLVVTRSRGAGLPPGEVAEVLGLPLWGVLPAVRGLAAEADRGRLADAVRRGRTGRAGRDVLARLSRRGP